jgi:hypothetical protein
VIRNFWLNSPSFVGQILFQVFDVFGGTQRIKETLLMFMTESVRSLDPYLL